MRLPFRSRFSFAHACRAPLRRVYSGRVLAAVLCVGLAACASKNPLIDDDNAPVMARSEASPAVTAKPATTLKPDTAAAASSSTATAPEAAAPQVASAESAAPQSSTPSGVQTIRRSRFLGFLTPYRPDIQQGNFVSKEMLAQLRNGMTPEQVRFVLGTPLLTDMFHADRWDYVFRLQSGKGDVTQSRVVLFFKDNRLARWEGGDLPTEADYLARIAGAFKMQSADQQRPARSAPSGGGDTGAPGLPIPMPQR